MIHVAGIPVSVVFILFVELAERFCFFTIQGSQKFFLLTLDYSSSQAQSIVSVFNTACYVTCLPGGALGDRFLGRYLTVGCLSTVYVAGVFMVALATRPDGNPTLFFIGAFGFIALGTGGIKPVVCNFGADQIEGEDAGKAKERFFSYFYWTVNIGATIAIGVMTSVATTPESFGISPGWGYYYAYLIAAFAMLGGLVLFLGGSCVYIKKFLTSNTRIFRPVFSAMYYSATVSPRGAIALVGWVLTIPFFILAIVQAFLQNSSLATAAFVIAIVQLSCLIYAHLDNSFITQPGARDVVETGDQSRLMDVAQGQVGIRDVQLTFQTIPLLLIANTIFNFSYSMMIGPFVAQSCQMNLFLGTPGGVQINGTIFNLADAIAILLFIPIFEGVLYPLVDRWRNRPVSSNEKLIGGFTWSALAMVVAILLELTRKNATVVAPDGWNPTGVCDPNTRDGAKICKTNFPCMNFSKDSTWDAAGGTGSNTSWDYYKTLMGTCKFSNNSGNPCDLTTGSPTVYDYCSNCASFAAWPKSESLSNDGTVSAGIYMSDISGWWMLIPFAFIGMGEIMINPVLYYYAYSMTPGKTQSIIQAVNLVFQGAYPPALQAVFTTLLKDDEPNNLNNGRVWMFYVISLVFIVIGTPIFFLVQRYSELEQLLENEDQDDDSQLSASVVGAQMTGSWAGPVT